MQDIEVTDEWLYKHMPIVDEAVIRSLEENMDGAFSVIYENDLGEWIVWDQKIITTRTALTLGLDSEYDDMVVTQINGANLIVYIYSYGKIAYYDAGVKTTQSIKLYLLSLNCTMNKHKI